MKILVLNTGSSSLKYQLFDVLTNIVLAKGLVVCHDNIYCPSIKEFYSN